HCHVENVASHGEFLELFQHLRSSRRAATAGPKCLYHIVVRFAPPRHRAAFWSRNMSRALMTTALLAVSAAGALLMADDGQRLLSVDHFVRVTSTVPAIAGQPAQLYVRERVLAGTALRGRSFDNRVVLFVHGAGTPAEVSFDVPYQDYSWMGHLARAG